MFEESTKEVNFDKVLPQITLEEENIVRRLVNPHFFDVDSIIEYLNSNEMIGVEIFENALTPRAAKTIRWTYLKNMVPVERSTFVERLFIYVYDLNHEEDGSPMTDFFEGYRRDIQGHSSDFLIFDEDDEDPEVEEDSFDYENLYRMIVEVVKDKKIPIEKVFSYLTSQYGDVSYYDLFDKWYHYIKLVGALTEENVFPKNILYSYNLELEKAGKTPIMYYPSEFPDGRYTAFKRGDSFLVSGFFPYDENGEPVFKWIGMWAENIIEPSDEEKKLMKERNEALARRPGISRPELRKNLRIRIKPDTRIFFAKEEVLKVGPLSQDVELKQSWEQYYVGPKAMEFDYQIIAKRREEDGLSLKDVADATAINLRTLQRIESGESTPDGLNLMKIADYLCLSMDDLVKKYSFEDTGFSKFRSGNALSSYLPSKETTEEA